MYQVEKKSVAAGTVNDHSGCRSGLVATVTIDQGAKHIGVGDFCYKIHAFFR